MNLATSILVKTFLKEFEEGAITSKVLSSFKIYVGSTSDFEVGSALSLGKLTKWESIKKFFGLYKQESYEILNKTESYLQITPTFNKKPSTTIATWSVLPKPKGDTVIFKRPNEYMQRKVNG